MARQDHIYVSIIHNIHSIESDDQFSSTDRDNEIITHEISFTSILCHFLCTTHTLHTFVIKSITYDKCLQNKCSELIVNEQALIEKKKKKT